MKDKVTFGVYGLVRADAFGTVIGGFCGHEAGVIVVAVWRLEGDVVGVGGIVVGRLTEQCGSLALCGTIGGGRGRTG